MQVRKRIRCIGALNRLLERIKISPVDTNELLTKQAQRYKEADILRGKLGIQP